MSLSGHFSSALVTSDELAMYRAMIDHLPVGIGVFDKDFRLLAINRLLVDMLDFPLSLFETSLPTLEELTLFNAQRGEYGAGDPDQQTAERMVLARQRLAHRFQRTRPNGRVFEIIGAPLPNGGFIRRGIPLAPQVAKSPNGRISNCPDRWERLSDYLGSIP